VVVGDKEKVELIAIAEEKCSSYCERGELYLTDLLRYGRVTHSAAATLTSLIFSLFFLCSSA